MRASAQLPPSRWMVLAAAILLVPALASPVEGSATAKPGEVAARIDAFWVWWRAAAPRLAAAIDARRAASIAEEIGRRVNAVDPHLAWETGPGLRGARHHFALSPEGDAELRILTERWLARAPAADGTWEFYGARQPLPPGGAWSLELDVGSGPRIDFASVRAVFETDTSRERIRVTVHHPAFAKLAESERTRATFLLLDNLLGEDGVERWIGGVRTSPAPLAAGKPPEELARAVTLLEASATRERFALLRSPETAPRPKVAIVNMALKRIDHLLMDQSLTVTFPLQQPTGAGLTTDAEYDALNALEDDLMSTLGREAVYIGHETGEAKRVLFFHAASTSQAERRARDWVARHPERTILVAVQADPRWEVLDRW